MFCNKCGTENPDEAMFCSSCGNNMKQNKSGRLKLEKVPEDNVTESVTNEDGDSQDTTDSPETDQDALLHHLVHSLRCTLHHLKTESKSNQEGEKLCQFQSEYQTIQQKN